MAATTILNWVIYVLKCPRTRAVRYVGWTTKSVDARLREHLNRALKKPHEHYRNRWIMSLISIGLCPVIEVIETGSGENWGDAERRWIAAYRASGARLVNGTNGGDGVIGWGTPEQRSERAVKSHAARTPEQRSAEGIKRRAAQLANSTPNELARISKQKSESLRKSYAVKTAEERMERISKARAALTPEQRSELLRKAHAAKTAEERSDTLRKANAARTPEQRVESTRKARAAYFSQSTHEQRAEATRKAWATRRRGRSARA